MWTLIRVGDWLLCSQIYPFIQRLVPSNPTTSNVPYVLGCEHCPPSKQLFGWRGLLVMPECRSMLRPYLQWTPPICFIILCNAPTTDRSSDAAKEYALLLGPVHPAPSQFRRDYRRCCWQLLIDDDRHPGESRPPCLANYPIQFSKSPSLEDTSIHPIYNLEFPALALHAACFNWAVYLLKFGPFCLHDIQAQSTIWHFVGLQSICIWARVIRWIHGMPMYFAKHSCSSGPHLRIRRSQSSRWVSDSLTLLSD